jgi:murein endopeptidase
MRRRGFALACLIVVLAPASAAAEHLVVESGETLWGIARRHGCTVEAIQRANDLRGSTIYAGQKLVVPRCEGKTTGRAARVERRVDPAAYDLSPGKAVPATRGQSIGRPWSGSLANAVVLPRGKGYLIRRPARAWGTSHAVAHTQRAIAAVRKRFPRVHTLAIGDLSARKGGAISEHRSHQSGRDVDLGFYFKKPPKGYPENFVAHDAGTLDLAATWALLHAFARTAADDHGVQAIFLDYEVQKRLYEWAKDHGVPRHYLDGIFEYPQRGSGRLVRHVDNHHDHFHIRFKCPPRDAGCSP